MRFELHADPLSAEALKSSLAAERAGGFVAFEGWVRDHNDGRAVIALEYEAYEALALKEGERILDEARTRFAILDARCAHRVGRLAVGDLAVWIGVTAEHRSAAFNACRHIIDEIKSRVPIWKHEIYRDGDAGWVNPGLPGTALKG